MKRIKRLVVLLCMAIMMTAQVSYAEDAVVSSFAPSPCDLPSTAAVVMVRDDEDTPVYEFTISNNHTSTIYMLILGEWPDGSTLDDTQDNLYPVQYITPEGWRGRSSGREGGVLKYHFGLMYGLENPLKHVIMPGETRSGFKIIMSEPFNFMMTLPYIVKFSDGKCMYGTVVEAQE